MSTQLIAHLKEKCQADDNVKILLSQWEFDQKLVGKALENIGGFYPHFSNHNASHSQQILVNIERVLGKDIELLSATDTWLILEAAYWHDIGMLVDAKNAKAVHENADFLFMIKTIANDKGHDLNLFCKAYEQGGWNDAIGSEDHPFDGVEKYRQLIAEWFRRNHDKRIGSLVSDPFSELGISSPRTELLPNRLYRYLGQICMSHGMNFQKVMEKLPYKQTGLGVEDCHPRFVGCLLRLGDLFDLDDNRFCPVMAKHVSNMPSLSQHHKDKHLSLREFQLDKRTVKLVAECPDEMSYIETQNWFGWIREEFQNQMSQWNLIVPHLGFGSLPTIEQLDVFMEKTYDGEIEKEKVLLNNKPMKFSLDEVNVMEILQGANLYKDKLSIFRELIQNAVDATMLRIYLFEIKNNQFNCDIESISPEDCQIKALFEKYSITIRLSKKERRNSEEIWSIIIQDQGIGIGIHDLNYMQNMAGSSRNIKKSQRIKSMPKWMRPSGEFGIGLHSVFLLTKDLPDQYQEVTYKTKSIFSNEYLEIQMNSPLGTKKGYCFISKLSNSDSFQFGTTLETHFSIDKRDKFNSGLYLSRKNIYIENYDLMSQLVIWETYKNLSKIAMSSLIKIKLDGFEDAQFSKFLDYEDNYFPNFFNKKKLIFNEKKLWSNKEHFFFKINILNPFEYNNTSSLYECIRLLFKGQEASLRDSYIHIEEKSIFDFFSFEINFFGLDAKSVLTINRDSWKKEYIEKFYSNFNSILNNIYDHNYDDLKVLLNDDFYLRLFGYCIGRMDFIDVFTIDDINRIFYIDISKESIIKIGDIRENIFNTDINYPLVSPRSSYFLSLLKKYLVSQGKQIYGIRRKYNDDVKEIGVVCLAANINIKDIVEKKYSWIPYNTFKKVFSFNEAIMQSFYSRFGLRPEIEFYLYIELGNIGEEIEKDYKQIILKGESKILSPLYIYHSRIMHADIQYLVDFLFERKLIDTDLSKQKVLKIYEKLRLRIIEVMQDTALWKELNESKSNIRFIDE